MVIPRSGDSSKGCCWRRIIELDLCHVMQYSHVISHVMSDMALDWWVSDTRGQHYSALFLLLAAIDLGGRTNCKVTRIATTIK